MSSLRKAKTLNLESQMTIKKNPTRTQAQFCCCLNFALGDILTLIVPLLQIVWASDLIYFSKSISMIFKFTEFILKLSSANFTLMSGFLQINQIVYMFSMVVYGLLYKFGCFVLGHNVFMNEWVGLNIIKLQWRGTYLNDAEL